MKYHLNGFPWDLAYQWYQQEEERKAAERERRAYAAALAREKKQAEAEAEAAREVERRQAVIDFHDSAQKVQFTVLDAMLGDLI